MLRTIKQLFSSEFDEDLLYDHIWGDLLIFEPLQCLGVE